MLWSFVLLITLAVVIPYGFIFFLEYYKLKKFQFTAGVSGLLALKQLMVCFPIHIDFYVVIRVAHIGISMQRNSSKLFNIRLRGFEMTIVVRDRTEMWANQKAELHHLFEEVKHNLEAKGLIQTLLQFQQKD